MTYHPTQHPGRVPYMTLCTADRWTLRDVMTCLTEDTICHSCCRYIKLGEVHLHVWVDAQGPYGACSEQCAASILQEYGLLEAAASP